MPITALGAGRLKPGENKIFSAKEDRDKGG